MNLSGVLLWLLVQTAQPSPAADLPAAEGVYYRPPGAAWVRLEPAPVAEMKTKGMGLYLETDGYTSLGMNIVCRGAKAALRISNPKPSFYVRGTGSADDIMLVQLQVRKDSRSIRASSADSTLANKGGFKQADIHKLSVTALPDKSFMATPEEGLKPGEYLLVFGYATTGFDFGIQ